VTAAYFDTSAFVKLFIEESGSDDVATLWDAADVALSSRILVPEVAAALAMAQRTGRLDTDAYQGAVQSCRRFVGALRMVELTSEIAASAAEIAASHALSGADAIHLASAMLLGNGEVVLATWDRRLHEAATANGLAMLPAVVS